MYYRCPKCGVWQRACNITLTRIIDGKENKMGGKPVFRVVNNKAE